MTKRVYPNLDTFFRESGVTQCELAAKLHIQQSRISRIKNNIHQPPLDLALKIARATNVPLESLIRKDRQ